RTSTPTPTTTCSKAKKCEPEVTATGCESNDDCDDTVTVADDGADNCANGKCTCDTDHGLCYRSCSEDLDCPVRYSCDKDASLCRPSAECDSDAYCVTSYNDVNAKCVDGACQAACRNDIDCNNGSLTNGTSTRICNAKHVCEDVGCTSDDQCEATGGVRTFCTKAPEATVTGGVVSAVTD
ncbi:MAG TPA: hypothetical protein VEQ59_20990, partial [Polyangiaceae bacterium]|nr:hypothetical protein [Polyangiaceae bacterium]